MVKSKTKKIVSTSLLIALGIILPMLFHTIPNAGSIFLPIHIPILLCGLICGWEYGLLCGIATPLLSSLLTGMPPAAYLPGMVCELAVYGAVAGILIILIKTKNRRMNIYISLIGAMIVGRVVWGILNAFIFNAGEYSIGIWITGAFLTALPGILIQLIVIPLIIEILSKTKALA